MRVRPRALAKAKAKGMNRICIDSFEKRDFVRVGYPLLIRCRKTEKTGEKQAYEAINLSGSGVLFRSSDRYDLASIIELEFAIPEFRDEEVTVTGKVVRIEEVAEEQFDVGVRFLEIGEKERAKICRILFEQKKQCGGVPIVLP